MRVLIGGEDELAVSLAEVLMKEHDVTVLAPTTLRGSSLDRLDDLCQKLGYSKKM